MTVSLRGKIFSGKSEAARFIELDWVKRQMVEKLGFTPYPGTLNLKLVEESVEAGRVLKNAEGIEISPARGFCRGKLFKAILANGVKCAVVVPEVNGYPEEVIEVVASANLKEKLKSRDGDEVEIKISF